PDYGHHEFGGEFDEWPEHCAHVSCAETVDLTDAEISCNRIDLDQLDVANFSNFLAQQINIGDKTEHASFVTSADHADDLDATEISTGGEQARHDSIGNVVFCCE